MIRFGGTLIDIGGIVDWRLDNGIAEIVQSSDGEVDPRFATAMTQAQRIRFRSVDVKKVLDNITQNGLKFQTGATQTSCAMYFRKRAPGGIYVGTTNDFIISATTGLAIPKMVRGNHGQIAEVEVEIIPVSDPATGLAPLTADTGQTLPGFTFGPTQLWTVGPAFYKTTLQVGVTTIEGVQDLEVDFGIEVETVQGDGFPWSTQVSIKQRRPKMRLTTFHLDHADDDAGLDLIGTPRNGNTRLFLRKKAEGGANVADGTAEHIRFDMAQGRISVDTLGASHPESARLGLNFTPSFNSSVDQIVVNTAAAVSGA